MVEEKFDRNALAIRYGKDFGIERCSKESDSDYRVRVAGILREQGKIVEAHEALAGKLYDDSDQGIDGPMTGLIGAMQKVKQKIEFSPNDPIRQLDDDICAGIIVTRDNSSEDYIRNVFDTFGPETGMDIIERIKKIK
ncbi:MAG: hypothetical protein WC812_02115 [Candidatus Pacearchaeota archaeon]|jgi:hypothetical protein